MEPGHDLRDFVENAWIGGTLAIGEAVRLSITGPCPRCVMTTPPQGDLPRDPGILRTAAQHNGVNVGVYASVPRGGSVRRGDPVTLAMDARASWADRHVSVRVLHGRGSGVCSRQDYGEWAREKPRGTP